MKQTPLPQESSRSLQNQPTSLSSQRARIAELRAAGHNIRTQLGELPDNQGRPHPLVATYYLSGEPINASEVAA